MGTIHLPKDIKKLIKRAGLLLVFILLMGTWSCKTCNCPAYTYKVPAPADTEFVKGNTSPG